MVTQHIHDRVEFNPRPAEARAHSALRQAQGRDGNRHLQRYLVLSSLKKYIILQLFKCDCVYNMEDLD